MLMISSILRYQDWVVDKLCSHMEKFLASILDLLMIWFNLLLFGFGDRCHREVYLELRTTALGSWRMSFVTYKLVYKMHAMSICKAFRRMLSTPSRPAASLSSPKLLATYSTRTIFLFATPLRLRISYQVGVQ